MQRISRLHLGIALVVLLASAVAVFYWQQSRTESFALLTPEEQNAFQSSGPQQERAISVSKADGPVVTVSAPQGFSLASPVDFDIQVRPRDGVPVDMGSIRIEYRLGPAWVNMTRRIMKYARVRGTRLYARGAELPKGKHALRVTIRDTQKRLTQATVSFTVTR